MADSVWVIEQGSYSDYRVVGVFSTRENAEAVAAKINVGRDGYDEAEVSEWPLDPGVEELRQGFRCFRVLMLADGTTESVKPDEDPWLYPGHGSRFYVWRRTQVPAYRRKGVPDALRADVWAKDEAHAVKIANETRVQMIASGEWALTPEEG